MARVTYIVFIAGLTCAWVSTAAAQAEEAEATPVGTPTDAGSTGEAGQPPGTTQPVMQPMGSSTGVAAAPVTPATSAGDAEPQLEGGVRFRFGVSAGGGALIWDGPTLSYGGADVRLGVQVNQLLGIYVQPQLGFYSGQFSGSSGVGGLIGVSAGVDFTFIDRFFVGAGGGYGVLNNPHGPELHFRLGGYPLVAGGVSRARRKGLMLGVDIRVHFLDGATFFAPTFSVGYEAF